MGLSASQIRDHKADASKNEFSRDMPRSIILSYLIWLRDRHAALFVR